MLASEYYEMKHANDKYYICCNLINWCWEVKAPGNKVLFAGTLADVEKYKANLEVMINE